jgi:hypothetical protein
MKRAFRRLVFGAVALLAVMLSVQRTAAHKPITSRYTYNHDVFPIFRDRCSRCHVTGGVAPMSLVTYEDAIPWAQSLQSELIVGTMPPATADVAYGAIKHAPPLAARDLDVILDWATGGSPQGPAGEALPAVSLKSDWPLGAPDLPLRAPSEVMVPPDRMELTQEFAVASGTSEPRWVRAIDLLPGTPAIVRSALIYIKPPAGSDDNGVTPDRVLARWLPGQDPEPLDGQVALRLPANATIVARVHYKKTWQLEGKPISDRSTIGIYFATARSHRPLTAIPIASPPVTASAGSTFAFSQSFEADAELLAVEPDQVPPNVTLRVEAVRPDGSRAAVARFTARPDWDRRYWLEQPLVLPRGTRIEVTGASDDSRFMAVAFGLPAPPAAASAAPVRLAVDICAGGDHASNR